MGPLKCCVGGCDATSDTHRLFSFPRKDKLRALWMSFVVPTNPELLNLNKFQLISKRVCEKHFDRTQFDAVGNRLRYAYPSLITEKEIEHGEPLSATVDANILTEHNYCKERDDDDVDETMLVIGKAGTISAPKVEVPSIPQPTNVQLDTAERKLPQLKSKTKATGLKKMSQKKRKFIKQCINITNESLGQSGKERVEAAQKTMDNHKLFENFHALSKQGQTFLIMQLRNCRKNKMARRFSMEEKLMALLMLKHSPKEYKLLESMFALPNKRTLHRISEKISIEPGLNPQIFEYIQNKTKNWNAQKKLCTIVFDEVSLTPHLIYNEKKDQIVGFVDQADERHQKFCDHALVFMLRGICSSWRQSVAYYFCEGTVSASTLQKILKQIVAQVAETGLSPLGLVCDQGSTFRTAIKNLRQDTIRSRNLQGLPDDGSVEISGHNLNIFYDPPHLLKGLRNNFLNKNIVWEGKLATWKDIEFIYDLDSKLGHTRALPNLTAHHIDPNKMKKMKVSVATQVLSARTAAMLKYTNALNYFHTGREETMGTTAEVVEFFDILFDSVNGHPGGTKRGKLRKAVKNDSEHVPFWTEAILKLKNIKFEDSSSKVAIQAGKPRLVRVPSLDGWITTLESFIRLSKILFEKYSVEYFYPRNINQDPLENFFGRVRALNYRNVNPNANTFIHAFKSLLLTNILSPHSKFANCELDNGESLIDLAFLFEEKNINVSPSDKENEFPKNTSPLPTSQERFQSSGSISRIDVQMEKVKVQCSAYTAGYICRKLSNKFKCRYCLKSYTSESAEDIHTYIKYRNYKMLKNENLVYPTGRFLRLYRDLCEEIHNYLNYNSHKSRVSQNLTRKILNNVEFSWLGCATHAAEVKVLLIKLIIRIQVHNWCNTINKILKGGIQEKYISKMEPIKKLAIKKYKTFNLRKKALNK